MLEVLSTNYIRTARAFGLRERVIFYKYALKNAIIPTVAVLGVGLGELMGGAIFVEVIFTRPGLGRLAVDAIADAQLPDRPRRRARDRARCSSSRTSLADLSYRLLDPRIRVEDAPVT